MRRSLFGCLGMIAVLFLACGRGGGTYTVDFAWQPVDETYVFSSNRPRLTLAAESPRAWEAEPVYRGTPRYALLPMGDVAGEEVGVALDLPATAEAAELNLYVDANHNGDLTDDPVVELAQYPEHPKYYHAEGQPVTWMRDGGSGEEEAKGAFDYLLYWDREADNAELRPSYVGRLRGEIVIGEEASIPALLYDADLSGSYNENDLLVMDMNRDGELDGARNSVELYRVSDSFLIGEKALMVKEVAPGGERMILGRALGPVEPRVALVAGMPAPDFTLADLEGNEVEFASYEGDPLILIFWASW